MTFHTTHLRPLATPLLLIALGGATLPREWTLRLGATSALAQGDAGAMSPTVLRRLAEVADGHRTGSPIFVVLSRTFPHPVIAIADTRERASVIAAANPDFGVFGPVLAPPEPDLFLAFCVHDARTSYMHPDREPLTRWVDSIVSTRPTASIPTARRPDTLPPRSAAGATSPTPRTAPIPETWHPSLICPPEPTRLFRNADIDSLSMTFYLADRTPVTLPVPRSADALFFTLTAMDKFVFPYYVKVLGVDSVAALRRDFVSRLRR